MNEELSDAEKSRLGHEAFASFLEQFKPLDNYSITLLDVLFELLMKGKFYGTKQNLSVSRQKGPTGS
jgi:hypothetical protein